LPRACCTEPLRTSPADPETVPARKQPGSRLGRILPAADWLRHYQARDFPGDLVAGVVVAIMLVPQGMAYAMLANLPPQVGLYASMVPLLLYSLLGTSKTLAVGPVAIVSVLVAVAVSKAGPMEAGQAVGLAIALALAVGVLQLVMGVLRLGFLVNFLSDPVIAGFTNAAALVIALSQVKHLLGISLPHTERPLELLLATARQLPETNPATFCIGIGSVLVLVFFSRHLAPLLRKLGVSDRVATPLAKTGPLVTVAMASLLAWQLDLAERMDVKVVGVVPSGLPQITIPALDWSQLQMLLPMVAAIAVVGYVESYSIAKNLASRRRERVDANGELIGLGAANLGAAFTGGYPVTGGLSRSLVNYSAGARTGLAAMVTAGCVSLTVLFFTPAFRHLPQAVLAAIILVAVSGLIDLSIPRRLWRYNRHDFASFLVTFSAVLGLGVEIGIGVGAASALWLFIFRASRPHVAVLGRVGNTEHFRNVLRHTVQTRPDALVIRIDASLYFGNARFVEDYVLGAIADQPEVRHVVLVCSAINAIDATALETLERLLHELRNSGVRLHLAEVKGPVMDKLEAVGFVSQLGRNHIHLSTHLALLALDP
jgi:sulfate permease, SulP family